MTSKQFRQRQGGMSIVELMVATVISLVGVLVIFQVFATNEEVRRNTTSGSDEQTSGLLALMTLERELRTAGFAVNDFDLVGCTMRTYDNARTPALQPDFPLAPVQIVANPDDTPDVIRVTYGGSTDTSTSVKLADVMPSVTAPITLIYRFGFHTSDKLVIGQASAPCTMIEVTALPGGSAGQTLEHANASYVSGYTGESLAPRFNDPAGTPHKYDGDVAKIMNLGPFPVRNEITVRTGEADPSLNNQLVVQNVWAEMAAFTPVAEQIVQLKAEYGMDDGTDNGTVDRPVFKADDNIVDSYTTTTPTNWSQVRTVRLAIVSRSLAPEKPLGGGGCDATPAMGTSAYQVRWARGPDAPDGREIDVSGSSANWQCFKYKVYETVVPLRNMLWRQV